MQLQEMAFERKEIMEEAKVRQIARICQIEHISLDEDEYDAAMNYPHAEDVWVSHIRAS